MRLVIAAAVVLVASFIPLLAVGLLDPSANPIGLGLLTVAGTLLAGVLLVIALVRALWRLLT